MAEEKPGIENPNTKTGPFSHLDDGREPVSAPAANEVPIKTTGEQLEKEIMSGREQGSLTTEELGVLAAYRLRSLKQ